MRVVQKGKPGALHGTHLPEETGPDKRVGQTPRGPRQPAHTPDPDACPPTLRAQATARAARRIGERRGPDDRWPGDRTGVPASPRHGFGPRPAPSHPYVIAHAGSALPTGVPRPVPGSRIRTMNARKPPAHGHPASGPAGTGVPAARPPHALRSGRPESGLLRTDPGARRGCPRRGPSIVGRTTTPTRPRRTSARVPVRCSARVRTSSR